jgi:excisionase family DNA binding protein
MDTLRISKQTADVAVPNIQTWGKTGVIPLSESRKLACIVRNAARVGKDDSTTPKAKPGLLPTEQVAERLQCSRKTVLRMADDGILTRRFLRPGNHKSLRFIEAEVSALCDLPTDGEA